MTREEFEEFFESLTDVERKVYLEIAKGKKKKAKRKDKRLDFRVSSEEYSKFLEHCLVNNFSLTEGFRSLIDKI